MEQLLHYIWKHRLGLGNLITTAGQCIEIIDSGRHNTDQGPDFFNAKVRLDGHIWAGNVEIHTKASDWYRHHHDIDEVYNNVILHVVLISDMQVTKQNGDTIPQVVIQIPDNIRNNYDELLRTQDYPRCHRMVPSFETFKVHMWMDALLAERMRQRSSRVLQYLQRFSGDWERVAFVTIARSFGFGLNGDAFELWAGRLMLSAASKHRDHLEQIQSLFLGTAGLLDDRLSHTLPHQIDLSLLQREWKFLVAKFSIGDTMQRTQWRYLRSRPKNFPEVRLLQIAAFYHSGWLTLRYLLETVDIGQLIQSFRSSGISLASARLVIMNAVAPLLYAYGMHTGSEELQERALNYLQQLPAEDNRILRQWRDCGITVDTAADSQALIQLKREYCDRLRCLHCRFGYEFLKV